MYALDENIYIRASAIQYHLFNQFVYSYEIKLQKIKLRWCITAQVKVNIYLCKYGLCVRVCKEICA